MTAWHHLASGLSSLMAGDIYQMWNGYKRQEGIDPHYSQAHLTFHLSLSMSYHREIISSFVSKLNLVPVNWQVLPDWNISVL